MSLEAECKVPFRETKEQEAELIQAIEERKNERGCISLSWYCLLCKGSRGHLQQAYGRLTVDVKALRAKALYTLDENMPLRKSHENPSIQELYKDYLGHPGSHKAHKLLHTSSLWKDFFYFRNLVLKDKVCMIESGRKEYKRFIAFLLCL